MSVNLRSLVGKLNDVTRSALEAAAGLCLARTHYDVEIEHY
jgi:type VI secretion system protein VasG